MTDNIMTNQEGQPVHVPGKEADNFTKDDQGTPVVPQGTEKNLSEAPKDTLPRPAPEPTMPDQQAPVVTQETEPQKAVEGTITYEELAAKQGFGSPDDLAKAYSNLRSQNSKVEATLAEAIRARQEGSTEEATSVNQEELQSVQQANTQEDALKIVNRLVDKRVRASEDKFDYQMHLVTYPDDRKYASEAIKIVRENPGIQWSVAFSAAKGQSLPQIVQKEQESGKKEAYENIEAKEAAQVVHGGLPHQPDPSVRQLIEGVKTGKVPLSQAREIINKFGSK